MTAGTFTVFTDVQLFEVHQAGDGGGQVGQVVIGHAQLLQGLAVEELLWKYGGETMEYHSLFGKIIQTFSKKVQRGQGKRTPAGDTYNLMLWKSSTVSAASSWKNAELISHIWWPSGTKHKAESK